METINDRLQIIVNDKFDGNKAAFAKAIGIAPTSISNYIGRQRASKPSSDMLAKIVNSLNVDAMWLLTGRETKEEVKAIATGKKPIAAIQSVVTVGESAVLQERIKSLERLLEEKERTIQILIGKNQWVYEREITKSIKVGYSATNSLCRFFIAYLIALHIVQYNFIV